MKELRASFAHLSQTKIIDKFNNPLKRRFDDRSAAPDRTESQNRALPQVLIVAFSDGHIKLVGDARLNPFHDSALAFERVTFGNQQVELEHSHDHGREDFPTARQKFTRR